MRQPGAGCDAPCKPVANGCDAHVEVPQRDDMKLREALKRARASKPTATLLVDASQTAAGERVEPAGVCPRTPPNAPLTRGRTLSVRRAFSNSTVLITGATGYLGSLVRPAALSPRCWLGRLLRLACCVCVLRVCEHRCSLATALL